MLAYVLADGNVIDKTLFSTSGCFRVRRCHAIASFPIRGLNCSSNVPRYGLVVQFWVAVAAMELLDQPLCSARAAAKIETKLAQSKGPIGSFDRDLPMAEDLWMEPVVRLSVGACFPPLLIFRRTNTLHTRINASTRLNTVGR